MTYRLWVNDERTMLVRIWESGLAEAAVRASAAHTWGPPVALTEEPFDQPGENPAYGPGNPDWERDFEKTREP